MAMSFYEKHQMSFIYKAAFRYATIKLLKSLNVFHSYFNDAKMFFKQWNLLSYFVLFAAYFI